MAPTRAFVKTSESTGLVQLIDLVTADPGDFDLAT
jgi:hypothetical protein